MKTRAKAVFGLASLLIPLILIGPEQYGYAFFGLLGGLGAAARTYSAESSVSLILIPICTIAIMILFSALGLISILGMLLQIAKPSRYILHRKFLGLVPLVFAAFVIVGLLLLKRFPGDPEILVPGGLFIFPISLFLSASCIRARTENEPNQ
jgi:hypothetical protein